MDSHQQPGQQHTTGGRSAATGATTSGGCQCSGFPPLDELASQSIQRVLKKFEEELEAHQDVPSDATKRFGDDLKAISKEYAGLTDLVVKYQAFYDKVDCLLADANRWKQDLRDWSSNNVEKAAAAEILALWTDAYEASEREQCTRWIAARTAYGSQLDCTRQAERAAEEAKDDFDEAKSFEKAVKDRHALLGSLYKQGQALNEAGQYNSVYAVLLEFCAAYNDLGLLETWERRRRCGAPPDTATQAPDQTEDGDDTTPPGNGQGGGARSPCDATPEQDLKSYWTVLRYRNELTARLRAYLLARYSFFRWSQQRLDLEIEAKRAKDALDRFQKVRQGDFIREAADAAANERSAIHA